MRELFTYLTSRRSNALTFRSHRFRAVPFPRALHRKRQENFGVTEAERAGITVRVTSLERTFVDVLDRPDLGGGWEEIWHLLESVEFFDLDQVVEYALLLDNATTVAKVGFYLKQHREALMVGDAHVNRLLEHRPRRPHYMVRSARRRGRLVARWALVVPAEILDRSWQDGR